MPYDVTIDRLPSFALYDLKGSKTALNKWSKLILPETPNRYTNTGENTLCYIGPNHWLLRAQLNTETSLENQLRPTDAPADISIVRISDTQAFFRVSGNDAMQIMSVGCPMDLHESVFPENGVSFTEFFQLKALVLRSPDGFDVAVEQSFGNMIADYLNRATA